VERTLRTELYDGGGIEVKRVGYLVTDLTTLSEEESAGWKFLLSSNRFRNSLLTFDHIAHHPSLLKSFDILWWHFDSSTSLPEAAMEPKVVAAIKKYLNNGGAILLTLLASHYVVPLGLESTPLTFCDKGTWNRTCWAEKYPDIRGLTSYRGHPIFKGLHGAAFTWSPEPASPFAGAFHTGSSHSSKGRVVAVAREYLKLNEDWRIATEYESGKGRALTIGTFLFLADDTNRFRPHLELLLWNTLHYLTNAPVRTAQRRTYWSSTSRTVTFYPRTRDRYRLRRIRSLSLPSHNTLPLHREQATANPFNVGGRRILIVGNERTGIEEVWAHPICILKNMRIAVKIGGREFIGTEDLRPSITVSPDSIVRTYRLGETTLRETTFADLRTPGGATIFEESGNETVEIAVSATSDMRIMWPLSEKATGYLQYSWHDDLQAAIINAADYTSAAIIGGTIPAAEYLLGRYSAVEIKNNRLIGIPTDDVKVGIGIRWVLKPNSGCGLIFSGSSIGENQAISAYSLLAKNPALALRTQQRHVRSLVTKAKKVLDVRSPQLMDSTLHAIVATDRFLVTTPEIGTSLMAGFASTRFGWNGAQAVSGRPGYAWYFGRDSVWTALAMLAYDDHKAAKQVLQFLGTYQDITGKIAHEITTSGHVHYDAADATPLYIVLMGRYLRATGDKSFVMREFHRIRKAISFCYSTDQDGDHLIENTDVGHGWIEGGPLAAPHAELYLNACWYAALVEASYIAGKLSLSVEARAWKREAAVVKKVINTEFIDKATGLPGFALRTDGSLDTTLTALAAVAILFKVLNRKTAQTFLRTIQSEHFTTAWGVRMIGRDNPLFNPEGYHYGSVWPLFTGWVSLAEITAGMKKEALEHLRQTLRLHTEFSLGYIPEVLHGEKCEPAGVCHHQAWSEALAVWGMALLHRKRRK
jgi:GH15 family glucan-1,4-alpha-glucosidase